LNQGKNKSLLSSDIAGYIVPETKHLKCYYVTVITYMLAQSDPIKRRPLYNSTKLFWKKQKNNKRETRYLPVAEQVVLAFIIRRSDQASKQAAFRSYFYLLLT